MGKRARLRRRTALATSRPGRVLRGWWPDHNPLRRGWDRAEAAIAVALIAMFVIGAPVAASAAARLTYAAARAQHAEQARWHRERAVLLAPAPHPALGPYGATLPKMQARWAAPHGGWRTGEVIASPGARAGSTMMVWVDPSGALAGQPLVRGQVAEQAALAAALAPAVVGLLLAGGWLLARRVLDRRRLAAWDAGWRVTGPRWTSRR